MNHVNTSISEFCPPWVEPPQTMPTGLQLLATMRGNRLLSIPASAYEEPIVSEKTAGRFRHMLMTPDAVKHVLNDRSNNYQQSDTQHQIFRIVRNSLFLAEGDNWKRQRRAVGQSYSSQALKLARPQMLEAAKTMLSRLDHAGEYVDMSLEARAVTFDVINKLIVGPDSLSDDRAVLTAIDDYVDKVTTLSVLDLIRLPRWIPQPRYWRARKEVRFLQATAQAELDRYNDGHSSSVFVEQLSRAVDQNSGDRLSQLEIRDNLLVNIIAGHDTSSGLLSWLLYLLAHNQEVQERARDEVSAVLGSNADLSQFAAVIGRLPYCRRTIDETMRLYPSIPIVVRQALNDDEIAGLNISRGDTILIPICAIHRHSAHWDAPHAFDPERFDTRPPRYHFMPFGGGHRSCAGAALAYQEAELLLAALLVTYRFHPTEQVPVPYAGATLRPKGGVHLRLERLRPKSNTTLGIKRSVPAPEDVARGELP